MLPDDDSQRAGALRVGEKVEFRPGVLEDIPFKDGAKFDYLYLSHVLEHTPSPEKAAKEINRVSKRGYIETPSPLREQITCPIPFAGPDDFHLHFVWKSTALPNTIAFVRKSDRTIGEFTPSPEGRLAQQLFGLARGKNGDAPRDIESLLPRAAKTTYLYYEGEMRVVEYASFAEAYARGDDAYRSAATVARTIRWPFVWRSSRFRKLRALLTSRSV
jgi:SAM-dependent methyltransferase